MATLFKNRHGEALHTESTKGKADAHRGNVLVLLGHGVTGNLDRPIVAETAQALNDTGFDTLRFSFSGNGDSEGSFTESTISKEVEDLISIIDQVGEHDRKLIYIGHSMGAAVGVLAAAQDHRIQALVSLAGMVETRTFAMTEFGQETPDEGLMWDEPDCPLSSAFMEDLCQTVVSVLPQAERISVPWLLVHGTADDVVLPKDSEAIKVLKGDAVTLVEVEGADHSFSEPQHRSAQTKAVVDWLNTVCQ